MNKVVEDINKLPKWAKYEIEKLKENVEYYKNKVMEIGGEKETNTYIKNYQEKPIYLPKNSSVTFKLGKNEEVDCRIVDEGLLEVHNGNGLAIKTMIFEPHCSGDIRVRFI